MSLLCFSCRTRWSDEGLRKAAEQYALLQSKGLTAQANRIAEEIILPNQRFLRNVLSPFRKAKRDFFLLGEAQQSQFYQDVAAALGQEPASVKTLLEDATVKVILRNLRSSLEQQMVISLRLILRVKTLKSTH